MTKKKPKQNQNQSAHKLSFIPEGMWGMCAEKMWEKKEDGMWVEVE